MGEPLFAASETAETYVTIPGHRIFTVRNEDGDSITMNLDEAERLLKDLDQGLAEWYRSLADL